MAPLEFDGLNLVSRDVAATVAFYRRLGVDIPERAIFRTETGPHHVGAHLGGGADLDVDSEALAARYNAGFCPGDAARTLIGFRLATREAVDATYHRLTAAGANGLQPPYDAFFGARYAIVEDPDGRPVGLKSPADPGRRTSPPDV